MAKRRKLGQAVALASAIVLNEATLEAPSRKAVAAGGTAPPRPSVKQNQWSGGIKFNLLAPGGALRHDSMEGKDYLVVPVVMITEGVHNGSGGPLYYPCEELGKTPESWNLKPIVVYHPEEDGRGISACQPHVVNSSKIGWIVNARWEAEPSPGRLKAEAWIDEARADEVDSRIMANVRAGKMVEVSTGLFTDNEDSQGLWKGETYSAVARNYRPDHLAILPDQRGSCSIADGAGLNRNKAGDETVENAKKPHALAAEVKTHLDAKRDEAASKFSSDYGTLGLVPEDATQRAAWENRGKALDAADLASAALERASDANASAQHARKALAHLTDASKIDSHWESSRAKTAAAVEAHAAPPTKNAEPTANEISFEDTRRAIYDGLDAKYGKNSCLSIEATYEDFFVFANQGKLFCQAYECGDDGTVDFTGVPTEVSKVTQYRDGEGEVVGNSFEVEDGEVLEAGDCSGEDEVTDNAWSDAARKKAEETRKQHASAMRKHLNAGTRHEDGFGPEVKTYKEREHHKVWASTAGEGVRQLIHGGLTAQGFKHVSGTPGNGEYEHANGTNAHAYESQGHSNGYQTTSSNVKFTSRGSDSFQKQKKTKEQRPTKNEIATHEFFLDGEGVIVGNSWTDEQRKKAADARKGHAQGLGDKLGTVAKAEHGDSASKVKMPLWGYDEKAVHEHLEKSGFVRDKFGDYEHAKDRTRASVRTSGDKASVAFKTAHAPKSKPAAKKAPKIHPSRAPAASGGKGTAAALRPLASAIDQAASKAGVPTKNSAFDELAKKLGKQKGVTDPKGLAAVIGRKKYGKAGMAAKAAAGKKKDEDEKTHNVGGPSVGSSQDPSDVQNKEDVQMNRAALIVALVANSGGAWGEEDRDYLEVQSLDRLVKLNSAYATGEGTETGDDEEGNQTGIAPGGKKKAAKKAKLEDGEINSEGDDDDEVEAPAKKPTKNATFVPPESVEDYLKKAPPQVATILNRQLRKEQTERASLIKSITANARCKFTAEQLAKWDSEDLVKLAQGFVENEDKEPTVNYAGLGDGFAPDVTTNEEAPLGLPSYDFTKK